MQNNIKRFYITHFPSPRICPVLSSLPFCRYFREISVKSEEGGNPGEKCGGESKYLRKRMQQP